MTLSLAGPEREVDTATPLSPGTGLWAGARVHAIDAVAVEDADDAMDVLLEIDAPLSGADVTLGWGRNIRHCIDGRCCNARSRHR